MNETVEPEKLRPLLREKISQLDDDAVVLLHQCLLRLEKHKLWDELKADFSDDRRTGRYEGLDSIISQVRAERGGERV